MGVIYMLTHLDRDGEGEAGLKAAETLRTSSRSHPLPQQAVGVSEGAGPSVQAGVAHSEASPHSPRSASNKEAVRQGQVASGTSQGASPPRRAGGLRNAEENDVESDSDASIGYPEQGDDSDSDASIGYPEQGDDSDSDASIGYPVARTGRDEAKATSGHFVDTLCEANAALSVCKEDGRGYSRSGGTLAQILRGVALRIYGTDAPIIGVYKLTNMLNGKGYVGKSVNIYARWAQHKSASARLGPEEGCRLLNNAVRKHGWEAFRKEVLWVGAKHELSAAEVRLIDQHRTLKPLGYNITKGGEESPFIDAEVRERANASKVDSWNARFEKRLVGLSKEEAARQRRKRDGRLRAKHRYKARKRGEDVVPISKEEANATRLAAANGEYATLLRKATYARKREAKRTGNLRANS